MGQQSTHVTTVGERGCLVARVTSSSLTEYECDVVRRQIEADAPGGRWKIVIDLTDVEFLASAGIGMIVALHNGAKKNGGAIVVAGVKDDLRKLLAMTKIDKLFPIVEDAEKGLKKLG